MIRRLRRPRKAAGGAESSLAPEAVCAREGHAGLVIRWGLLNQQPSNTYIFEHARCARCGALRWP
jgi:hypothetical protein